MLRKQTNAPHNGGTPELPVLDRPGLGARMYYSEINENRSVSSIAFVGAGEPRAKREL
jgi:hypothetical protein